MERDFARLQRRLYARRRLDLQLALVSALAAWTMLATLIARAQEAEHRQRLQRERQSARTSLVDVLHDIDDAGIGTEDLVAALLAGETAPDVLPDE
jgi:hypothetical protein